MTSQAALGAPLFDPGDMASSAPAVCRLDTRSSFGGRLEYGAITLNTSFGSPEDTVALDGNPLGAASGESFLWNTTAYADGPHTLALGAVESGVDILNDPKVVIHGGRLAASETWDAARLHIVRNWVAVPSGVTLTLEAGAVVKFCRYAGLQVEPGGVVSAVGTEAARIFLTHIADSTLGADANPDVGDATPALDDYGFDVRGTLTLSPETQVRYRSTVPGYPQISIGDRLVHEREGTVSIPVSISAAPPVAVSISWHTEDGTAIAGQDYTASSGVLTWAAGETARRFITVPVVGGAQPRPVTDTFFVQLDDPYAATIDRARGTIWITGGMGMPTESTAASVPAVCRLDTRLSFGGHLARGELALNTTAAEAAAELALDGAPLGAASGESFLWNTTAHADGPYTLVLGAVESGVDILNDPKVVIHGGRLAASETWDAARLHIVRNWVAVPSGVTLTIEAGAVVKFCRYAGLQVEPGGVVSAVGTAEARIFLTHVADSTLGGDANPDVGDATPGLDDYGFDVRGTLTLSPDTQVRYRSTVPGYPQISIGDRLVDETDGTVRVPVSLSAAATAAIRVSWRTEDGTATAGEDYVASSGVLTWAAGQSARQFITVPLIATVPSKLFTETFYVKLDDAYAAAIARDRATVWVTGACELPPGSAVGSDAAACRLDTRSSFGGHLARGELALNTTAAEAAAELALDGAPLGAASGESFHWNTTAHADGPHILALGSVESGVDILNDPAVVIHGGRLAASETWDAARLHIVRNWVAVPSGVTLTLEAGAVVKFCRYAGLQVEPGGVVSAVGTAAARIFLTHVADSTLGADVNPDVGDATPGLDDFGFDVRGTLTLSPETQVRYRSTVPGYPQISIGDRLVDETDGTVRVPVSLSAAATAVIRVSWRTEDGTATAGEDYVASNGVLTWAAGQSARQFIAVPLIVAGENKPLAETFFVQLEDPYAATFTRDRATVWIMDNNMAATDTSELAFVAVVSPSCRLDLRDDFSAWVVQGMVDLRYDASWREGAVAVQIGIDGTTVAEGVDGTFSWNTTLAENGAHALALTWVDGAGVEMHTTSVALFVINNAVLHRGRITSDETWAAGSVHIVLDPVIVAAGVTLTIEPGAIVKFCDGAGLSVEAGGTAIANGVIFTHIADDTAGGDSNFDGNASLPVSDAYALSGSVITDAATQLRFSTQTVSGTISTNQTWLSGRTYKVTGNITVASGAALTVLPGAIVKMGDNLSITVSSGGTLLALGNRALPIVFTSIKDDTHGGDTNGDGTVTAPVPGDWVAIRNNGGTVTLEHARILYGGWGQYANQGDGMVRNASGTLRLANCELRGALLRLVAANAGTVQIENSIMRDGRWGVHGTATVINCIIHDCENSLTGTGAAINSALIGCTNTVDSGYSLRYCNIWRAGNPRSDNGNLAVDPLFVDADHGDYRLQDGSPLIDAGDGAAAPELDYYGRPRMDVRTVLDTGTLAANGACPDIGIYEAEGEVTTPRPDLIAVSVSGMASATAGETVTVEWEVGNAGVAEAVGPRRDVAWLEAADPLLGSQTVKLGEYVAAIPVPVGGTQVCSAAFTLPPVSPGLWKYRIYVNAYRDVFEPQNATNNISLSEGTLTVASPTLGLGTSEVAVAPGESAGFRLDGLPAAGGTLMVTAGPGVRVLAAAGFMPTADRHQWTATDLGDGRLLLTIPPGFEMDGLFLALVNDTAVPVSVSVDVSLPVRELFGVSHDQFPNTGEAVFTTFGTGWSNVATAWLALGGATIPASTIVCEGSEIRLVFAVQGRAPGVYDLVVEEGADRRTLAGVIELTPAGRGPEWYCDLVLQGASRAGRECAGRFTYGNRGDTEMPAPYVRIFSESGNVLVKFDTKDYWQSGSLEFMAGSATWPASMLKPGENRTVEFRYYIVPNASGAASLRYTFTTASDDGFPWDANAVAMRPGWMSDEMWRFTLAAMRERIGETWNDWLECMRANMDYLAEMGQPTQRLAPLWQMEINVALNADGPLTTLAADTDARRAGRGMAVAFSRWYGAAIHQRFQDGILGYGWTHNYDIRLERLNNGKLARIRYPGGSERVFEKIKEAPAVSYYVYVYPGPMRNRSSAANEVDGSGRRSETRLSLPPLWTYWSPADANDCGRYWESSYSSLAYIVNNDGSQLQFDLASGRLLAVRNGKGQTLTLTYSGGLLARVTHTDGQFLEFAYAAGRLASVSDDTGRGVQYGYTGTQLSSVTAYDGLVTSYTYNSAPSTVLDKALTQVAYPDGTTLDFAYDDWGAVEAVSRNGSKQTVQYIWEGAGVYSIVDNDGGVSRIWRGAHGEVLASSDPLGRRSRYAYDATTRRLVATTAPGGERAAIAYDNDLHPIRTVNPLGFATEFACDFRNGDLTSVTDARGQRLDYRHGGAWGHLTAITYPDGTDETYTNAADGDVLSYRNRRAEGIVYEYDALGRTTRKEMPDGRIFTYTYDAKGNLTEATDSLTGAIILDYDAAERFAAITYPDGRGFTYTYDAAGRRASRTAHDGHRLVYEYDALGRFAALTDGAGGAVVRYTYDEMVGRLARQDFGNGTYTTFAYDLAGQLTGLAHHAADGAPLEQIAYTYDVNGRRNGMTTSVGPHAYRYDATGQLLGATAPTGANESFAYDPVGNRLAANGTAYTVNALNQYTAVGAATFTYDADGNLATRSDADGTTTYTYDAESRLVGVTRPDGAAWNCIYDALGNRVEVNDNGTVSRYVFDPVGLTDLAAEYDAAGSLVRRYLHAGWLAADETADGARRYYHADALSSTRLLTDDTGAVVATRDYTAFGQLKTATGEDTPFGYVGGLGVLADPTGLLHMRNRYYAPAEGRFVQLDPIGINAGDVNLYRYCGNGPVGTVDPLGLRTTEIGIPVGGVVSILAGVVTNDKRQTNDRIFGVALSPIPYPSFTTSPENQKLGLQVDVTVAWGGHSLIDTIAHTIWGDGPECQGNGFTFGYNFTTKEIVFDDKVKGFTGSINITYAFPSPTGGGGGGTTVPQSYDPNEVSGALGFGDPATQRYVQPGEWLDYTVYFENLATATGAAQEVRVTSPLSPHLDWASFETKEVAFNNQVDMGLAGRANGQSEVPLNDTDYRVRTEVAVDQASGVATWYLRIVDPTREDGWPADPYAGFLPPNDDAQRGEGHLSYRVKLREDAPAGGRIDCSASIVFDHNPAIVTSPAWFNWIADDLDMAGDTGTLTWDAAAGATYVVNIWTGDPDPNAEQHQPVATSDELTVNRWRLPDGLASDQMYYWQVTTMAGDGTTTTGPIWGFELGERVILDLRPGWNLVSLPFQPDEYSSRRLLRKQLFSFDATSTVYSRAHEIQTGAAYWCFRRQDESDYLDVFPYSSSRSLFDLVLNPGWNMVGPPEGSVTIAAGEASMVWEYVNGHYTRVPANDDGSFTLVPGAGYMIYK